MIRIYAKLLFLFNVKRQKSYRPKLDSKKKEFFFFFVSTSPLLFFFVFGFSKFRSPNPDESFPFFFQRIKLSKSNYRLFYFPESCTMYTYASPSISRWLLLSLSLTHPFLFFYLYSNCRWIEIQRRRKRDEPPILLLYNAQE